MRTTLTLEPEVAAALNADVRRTGRPFKVVVNDALKQGLRLAGRPGKTPRFRVQPLHLGVRPGMDLDRLGQLGDELETDETVAELLK